MRHHGISGCSGSAWSGTARLLSIFLLVCSFNAEATAPRITPQLFGEEQKADIVGYQLEPFDAAAKSDSALEVEIVKEAFNAAGKTPSVDVLPSKQLASYALSNNEALGLMGGAQDMAAKQKKEYRQVTFYLKADEPVSLFLSRKSAYGNELYQAFNEGLQKIVKNGKYLEILEKYHVKVSGDYLSRLKRLNPDWK